MPDNLPLCPSYSRSEPRRDRSPLRSSPGSFIGILGCSTTEYCAMSTAEPSRELDISRKMPFLSPNQQCQNTKGWQSSWLATASCYNNGMMMPCPRDSREHPFRDNDCVLDLRTAVRVLLSITCSRQGSYMQLPKSYTENKWNMKSFKQPCQCIGWLVRQLLGRLE